ncbi:hypothetical protein BU16DRAFT_541166 [Lophium mytilinum]|uniref:Uncharacterized protein n=1 Tax=Lophium mytilinum TaxID=390894 RepID=A0A6A6QNA1_9PEZI|nr:hypothetical protein BU16DRAFT_541166 [Lophium mytilinum]
MSVSKRVAEAIARVTDPNRAGLIIVSAPPSGPAPFTVEEDDLILRLRSTTQLSWPEIGGRFPERGPRANISVQVRQSRGLQASSKALTDVNAFRAHFGLTANALQNDVHFTRANGAYIRTPGSNVAVPAYGPTVAQAGGPQTAAPPAAVVPSTAPIPALPVLALATGSEIAPIAASSDSSSPLSEAPSSSILEAQEPPAPAPIPIVPSEHSKDASKSDPLPALSAPAPPASVAPQPTVAPVQTDRPLRSIRSRVSAPAAATPKPAPPRRAVGTRVLPPKAPPGGWHEFLRGPVPDVDPRGTPEHARLEADLKARAATFPPLPTSHDRANAPWATPFLQDMAQTALEDARSAPFKAQAWLLAPKPPVIPREDLEASELGRWLEPPKESEFPASEILSHAKWYLRPFAKRYDPKAWRAPDPKPAPKRKAAAGGKGRAAKKARKE